MLQVEIQQTVDCRGVCADLPLLHLPAFDLSYLREQIIRENTHGLTPEQVDDCIRKYRNYLALCKAYPDIPLMPCHDIDLVWHQHVLNTRQYHKDCVAYFGKYLHHNPIMPSAEVARNSRELYIRHFNKEDGYNGCLVMCCRTD